MVPLLTFRFSMWWVIMLYFQVLNLGHSCFFLNLNANSNIYIYIYTCRLLDMTIKTRRKWELCLRLIHIWFLTTSRPRYRWSHACLLYYVQTTQGHLAVWWGYCLLFFWKWNNGGWVRQFHKPLFVVLVCNVINHYFFF